jgi:dihydrofolate synthase/folylpolyglutamate synthase
VVTNIGWDHMHVLGNSLAAIAAEKAGIFKPGVPALTAARDPGALAILEFKARELDAPFVAVGEPAAARFDLPLPLLGAHQRWNGALAAAVVRTLRVLLPVSDEQLRRGLGTVSWPGRLQVVRRGERTLLLDGAHNRDGIRALREALAADFPGRHPTLVVGMLADKEWKSMAAELAPLASRIVTVPVSSARTVDPEELRRACLAAGVARPARAVGSVAEALKAVAADPFVLVTGSLYLVGEVLEQLGDTPAGAEERGLNEWASPSFKFSVSSFKEGQP